MRNARRPSPAVSVVRLTRLGYWSTARAFFVVSFALGLVLVAAAALLFFSLQEVGVLAQIDSKIAAVAGDSAFKLQEVVTLSKVLAVAAVLGGLFVGLSPLMGLCFAGFYNAAARLTGGVVVDLTATTMAVAPEAPSAPAADTRG